MRFCKVLAILCAMLGASLTLAARDEPAPQTETEFWKAKAAGAAMSAGMVSEAEYLTKQKLAYVQQVLDEYAKSADGYYPQHINQVVLGQYCKAGFYANPFTAATAKELTAQEVPLGWSEMHPGNFSYIQQYDTEGRVSNFLLLAYGATRTGGLDVTGDGVPDGVIAVLDNSEKHYVREPLPQLSGGRGVKVVKPAE